MESTNISLIGAGHMGRAVIGGLIKAGFDSDRLRVADPSEEQRRALGNEFGIVVETDNAEVASTADALIVAVKPQVIPTVLKSLVGTLPKNAMAISVAAGVPLARLAELLGPQRALIRAMPNTPALYQAGVTGVIANARVSRAQRQLAEALLAALGTVVWIDDEALMDVVTAVSGSGPAYFFALTEALSRAAKQAGMPAETAERLARGTAYGAGVMLARSTHDAGDLRRRVTSPGGTTEAALHQLQNGGLDRLIERAVTAAVRRGHELGSS